MKFVEDFCERRGWYWEPQGPQMLVRKRGGMRVMKEDEIWDGAENVWRHMPSCDVARG